MSRRSRRPSWTRGALISAAAITTLGMGVMAGCGDGAGSGGEPKVGLLVPLTGDFGAFGEPWRKSMQLAAKDINSAGGLPGDADLETVASDDESNPEVAVQEARKMINSQGVAAILGPTSGPATTIAPVAQRSRIPLVLPAASTVGLNEFGGNYVFRTVATDAEESLPIAKYLTEQKARTVSVLAENDESQISVAEAFQRNFGANGTGTVGKRVTFNAGAASYRTQVRDALSVNPEWIVCACTEQSGSNIIKTLDKARFRGKIMVTSDMTTPDAIKAVGPDSMEGVYGETASADTALPVYKEFSRAYKKAYGAEPAPFTPHSYDAMVLVGLAMVSADSTAGPDINSAIPKVASPPGRKVTSFKEGAAALAKDEDIDYQGPSGTLDLDKRGNAPASYAVQRVRSGAFKQVKFYSADEFGK